MLAGCAEADKVAENRPAETGPAKLADTAVVSTEIAVPAEVLEGEAERTSEATADSDPVKPTDTPATPTQTPEPPAPEPPASEPPASEPPAALPSPTTAPSFSGEPLSKESGELFSGSGTCTLCHTNLMDESGNDVSLDKYWRSTMMANAARDPYWQASVRAEVLELPELQVVIEDTCTKCHLPMGRTTLATGGEAGLLFGDGMLNGEHPLHELGMDGVSCTLCHQVERDNLGRAESFSGGYQVDTDLPAGERLNYGPFSVSDEDAEVMRAAVGFNPVQSEHIQQSELCATCHTLYTPTVDETGEIAGQFPEQTPFLEWLHSDYTERLSCQGCHMPKANGEVIISAKSDTPRSPFHRHSFVGGNAYVLQIFRAFGEEMGVTASSELIEATQFRVVNQLQGGTASIEIVDGAVSDGLLELELAVSSIVGHKFPSGFPSRRVWLHVKVTDAEGLILFESGGWSPDGAITGNDNDVDPAVFEPHYGTITDPDQVQIYEVQLVNTEGQVTTTLLRGAGYIKDNRLLPSGFVKETAQADIAVHGLAVEDPDFNGGGDVIRYQIETNGADGPYTVTVELLYQPVGYRWVQNLAEASHEGEAPEVDAFLRYYENVPNAPVVISQISQEIGP